MGKWSLYRLPEVLLCLFSLLWMAPLFYWCLTLTGTNPNPNKEYITAEPRSFPKMLILMLLFFMILYLAGAFHDRFLSSVPAFVLPTVFSFLMVSFSIFWILSVRTVPEADQWIVYDHAYQYLQGDYSMLERGGYMSIYSQNLGLMTLWMGLILLFGEEPFLQFQIFQALLLPVLVFCGYHITGMISDNNRRARFLYLLLITGCLPIYGYSAFMYNDLLSVILLFSCAYFVLRCLHNPAFQNSGNGFTVRHCVWIISAGLTAFLSVFIRKNSLVILLAFLIVIFIRMVRMKARKYLFLLFFSLLTGGFLLPNLAFRFYPHTSEDATSIPAITYLYMGANGRQDAPGWYDGSGLALFIENNFDPEATSIAAKRALNETVQRFLESPGTAFRFYRGKIISQWEAPMFQCLAMPRLFSENAPSYVHSMYYRYGIGILAEKYMKAYQLLLYGSILLFMCIFIRYRTVPDISWFMLLLGAWGGFLFSLIWEAKTRYVLPYFIAMIPYMAIAASIIPSCVKKHSGQHSCQLSDPAD